MSAGCALRTSNADLSRIVGAVWYADFVQASEGVRQPAKVMQTDVLVTLNGLGVARPRDLIGALRPTSVQQARCACGLQRA